MNRISRIRRRTAVTGSENGNHSKMRELRHNQSLLIPSVISNPGTSDGNVQDFLRAVSYYAIWTFLVSLVVSTIASSRLFFFMEDGMHQTHHITDDIRVLQTKFPVHVGNDFEIIQHPGFLLSDPIRLDIIFDHAPPPKTILVPQFWNPPQYPGGIRSFLGQGGRRIMSPEEAGAIGSYHDGHETVFVALASYRDPECLPTVEDIYRRAKYPERIRLAIVDQRLSSYQPNTNHEDEEPSCTISKVSCDDDPDQILCKYGHLIDSITIPAQYMVGPVFARHLAYRMYRGEYFAMQVDSHVRFVQDWDDEIIQQWKSTNNEMAVLSTYLSDVIGSIDPTTGQSTRATRSIMCRVEYEWKNDSREHIKYAIQPSNVPKIQDTPMLEPFWAAGFSFGRGHFLVQVPYDPYLPMVFQGEEISMTIRGFTYGYDFYAPVRNVAFHMYAIRSNVEARSKVSKFTENEIMFPDAKNKAYARLNGIIGQPTNPKSMFWKRMYVRSKQDEFGLGRVREAEKFYKTFGIHTETRQIEENLCEFVQGTPFVDQSMHKVFTAYLRSDGMGIDYRRITYQYTKSEGKSFEPDREELIRLRQELLRKRTGNPSVARGV